ncbi:uncharacterized protein LOC130725624 [Lotus japonicus]|uniref:uncharacterized protein LOC130725624 n=1 Tax=Lotus japonicus TaxID=34305 RepID=UPI002588E9D1|nr:uncharacterized protein LOC130725624 [Lotus japonicus]
MHHGYFLIQFDLEDDREKAMVGAPWMIYDHYLAVKPWTPDFVDANSTISTTAVWIRIPGLGFQFYDESILLTLASAVGTPIKVDMNTTDTRRGKYARVCVEINLNQPVLGRAGLRGVWYNIEYEGMHLLCSNCGCYGHLASNCQRTPVPKPTSQPAPATTASMGTPTAAAAEPSQETLGTETQMAENVIAGEKSANIDCPDAAHGDWMTVTRKGWKNLNASTKKQSTQNQKQSRASSGEKNEQNQVDSNGEKNSITSGALVFE